MDTPVDMLIIGAGPAGLAAAVNARIRGKSVLLISGAPENSGLYRAQAVGNYLGFGDLSGTEILDRFLAHAAHLGVQPVTGRVLNLMPMGDQFWVSYDKQVASARCVILATGVVQTKTFPGEAQLLGRGVSYCATCDGMLYRGKDVCVAGLNRDAEKEADYLREIGCKVHFFAPGKLRNVRILGEKNVEALEVDGIRYSCDGVFILRSSISPVSFLPGLALENGHIRVDRLLQSSIPGVFAAGDCTGGPYQINKAAGEGQAAALNAVEHWLQKKGES